MAESLTIGKLAKHAGRNIESIRFSECKALLDDSVRTATINRDFQLCFGAQHAVSMLLPINRVYT